MSRAFSGVRVLDLTHVLAGPFAAYQLGVLGADVIKIEPPDRPDFVRGRGPDPELNRQLRGINYQVQGGGKRAMTLDLRTSGGREVFRALVRTADVVVENYRAGALDRLGVGYEDLSAINPELIHCSMTGYGRSGPRAEVNAYDNVVQAASGVIARCDGHKPNLAFIDYGSGYNAAFAIAAALYARTRDGRGQRIDCAMFDTALMLMGPAVSAQLHPGVREEPVQESGLGAYETADGVFVLGTPTPDQNRRLWSALATEGHPHPRFEALSTLDELREHSDAMRDALREIFRTQSAAWWEEWIHRRGLPGERVRTLAEAVDEEQLKHRPFLQPAQDGDPPVPVAAFGFAHDGPSRDRPAPGFGEHTVEILQELGLSPADIDDLRAEGAI
ncbi:CaiB/BaiF CoA transferase family protein [Streptomyces roseifaciens]|uniref:CaiB/BaiF CoA transferase family protein n=1 Tax=Streptomyces roseifaciens TaxID=1488406 RepID=UPI000717F050|nr:CaiB/BaiF CoA-transferase family protein [Streptomyces roseifaciens]